MKLVYGRINSDGSTKYRGLGNSFFFFFKSSFEIFIYNFIYHNYIQIKNL